MQLQPLRTFKQVMEAKSLTRAASQLSLTQPAVTKQIAGLEQELGVKLLWRTGGRVHPTPAGELLYRYAVRITALADEAAEAVAHLERPGHGTVRIGTVSMLGTTVLPAVLAHFAHRNPAVQVRVAAGEVQDNVERLLAHEVDLAVVTVPVAHARIASLPLEPDPVVLVAAPAVAAPWPRPLPLARLADLTFVSYQHPSRFRTFVDGMLERQGVFIRVGMEFSSHEGVRSMVRLGLGAAFLPRSVVEDDLSAGALAMVEVADLDPTTMTRVTSLILPRAGNPTPAVLALLDSFADVFALKQEAMPEWARRAPGAQR